MMMPQTLHLAYVGFCGHIHFPAQDLLQTAKLLKEPSARASSLEDGHRDHLLQRIHPYSLPSPLPQPSEGEYLLLAGLVLTSLPWFATAQQIADALKSGDYARLPAGDYCG